MEWDCEARERKVFVKQWNAGILEGKIWGCLKGKERKKAVGAECTAPNTIRELQVLKSAHDGERRGRFLGKAG
jgi:hypothetical protein